MVMQKVQPRKPMLGNGLLLWLGVGIFLIGGAFIYVYGSLRSTTLSPVSTAAAVTSVSQPNSRGVPLATEAALRDLGIDAEASNLSPEAQSAIARAHQAALSAGRKQASGAEPSSDAATESGGDTGAATPALAPVESSGSSAPPEL